MYSANQQVPQGASIDMTNVDTFTIIVNVPYTLNVVKLGHSGSVAPPQTFTINALTNVSTMDIQLAGVLVQNT
jgi:hypothetical protein